MKIIVPLFPPSVNHYVKHTRNGRHYLTSQGQLFKEAVALLARTEKPLQIGKKTTYRVTVSVKFGPKDRGDLDNMLKCIGDALVQAGVIHTDAAIAEWHVYGDRKTRDCVETCIDVEVIRIIYG